MKTLEQVISEKTTFSVGDALSKGWYLISNTLLYYILGAVVTFLIGMACGFIPILGSIANSILISPALMGGAIYVTWRISNGEAWTDFAQMFKGFNYASPIMISSLIQALVFMTFGGLILMSFIPEFIQLYKLMMGKGILTNREEIEIIFTSFLNVKTFLLFGIFMIVAMVISVLWCFKTHFIIIYQMQGWQAMEASRKVAMNNFFQLIGLFLIFGVILFISAMLCGIGLLFSLPWMVGSMYHAFAQITQCDQAMDIDKAGFDFIKEENSL